MNPRSRCRRSGVTFFGTFATAAVIGCGGLASSDTGDPQASGEVPTEAPEVVPTEAPEVAPEVAEQMPPLFDLLELRQLSAPPDPEGARFRCDHATRIKVNMVTGHFITGTCEADANGSSSTTGGGEILAPAQLAAVQNAYRQVRSSSADKCTRGAAILTLSLEIDRQNSRDELLFADDDHAGCPVPGVPSTSFVSGLSELYVMLERVQGR